MKRKILISVIGMMFVLSSFSIAFADVNLEGGDQTNAINNSSPAEPNKAVKITKKTTVVKTETKYNVFVGYNSLTNSWSYADKYTISKGKGYSFGTTLSWSGQSISFSSSVSQGVAISIPADPKRASRLAVKATIKYSKVKVDEYWNGKLHKTYYNYTAQRIGAPTNYVKYK